MRLGLGDLAVYPAHGVGRIEAVERRVVGDREYDFLVMRILENDMRIMIPMENMDGVGLRPLIGPKDVERVYEFFKTPPRALDTTNWNRRHREYMEKIKTGSPFEVASVMGELLAMRVDKELSFGERKLLDTVRMLLVKEMALVSGQTEEEVEAKITSLFPPAKGGAEPRL